MTDLVTKSLLKALDLEQLPRQKTKQERIFINHAYRQFRTVLKMLEQREINERKRKWTKRYNAYVRVQTKLQRQRKKTWIPIVRDLKKKYQSLPEERQVYYIRHLYDDWYFPLRQIESITGLTKDQISKIVKPEDIDF